MVSGLSDILTRGQMGRLLLFFYLQKHMKSFTANEKRLNNYNSCNQHSVFIDSYKTIWGRRDLVFSRLKH